ncbi:MAG: GntR family transcriptional regulator [Planctomycetes bacterium]|jgi:GntR family transcriptional regulator|nr:GntR family transcriptional regulator [Planctomycetota bacterium]
MRCTVDPNRDTPPSRQVVDFVLDALARGELRASDRLPSVRELAVTAMVNPNTISKAYRELALRGVVYGRNGAGVFVTEEGPGLARSTRCDATREAVRHAIEDAVGAGHDEDALRAILDEVITRSAIQTPTVDPAVPTGGESHE